MSVLSKEKTDDQSHSTNTFGGARSKGKGHKEGSRHLSDKDWEQIFDNFLEHDKIDVPEDFYDEEILFESPNQLMDIYSYLEEQNLKKIKDQQDIEDQLEQEKIREMNVKAKIGGEIQVQEDSKRELESNIILAKQTLHELQKQSQMISTSNANSGGAGSKKKKQEEEEVNIDQLMDDIKKEICNCYFNKQYYVPDSNDFTGNPPIIDAKEYQQRQKLMESKQPIQLLHEIELKVTTLTNEIEYIQKAEQNGDERAKKGQWTKLLGEQEKDRKLARQEAQKLLRDEQDRQKNEKAQANLNKRMHAKGKKVGKTDMIRSKKPDIKREKVEKVVDEDTQD